MTQPVFIFGAFRSGTTAFCHLLREATNGAIFIEQPPKLCIEARELYEGRLQLPGNLVRLAKQAAIETAKQSGLVYVDKNPNFLMFAPWLASEFNGKFIYLHRDGREVVRSMLDWHAVGKKDIFTLAEDGDDPERVDPSQYPWDYSLFRPLPSDPLRSEWAGLSRFEKCSWYWAKYNDLALKMKADRAFNGRVLTISMSKANTDEIQQAYEFAGLTGFNKNKIRELLSSKINSLKWRLGQENRFPEWQNWRVELRDQFYGHAGSLMKQLGYQN